MRLASSGLFPCFLSYVSHDVCGPHKSPAQTDKHPMRCPSRQESEAQRNVASDHCPSASSAIRLQVQWPYSGGCVEFFREITRHRERSPSWLSTCPRAGLAGATTLMFRLRVSWSYDRLETRRNPLMRDAIEHFKRDSELRPAMEEAPAWLSREERAGAIGRIRGRRLYPTNVLSNSHVSGGELQNDYKTVRQAIG
jgi:hypothetical protein